MSDKSDCKTRFVILAVPRSGSNMLASWLNSHPDIICHHELFNPKGIRLALDLRENTNAFGTQEERDHAPLQFLEKIWNADFNPACVGFKFTYRQNEKVYSEILNNNQIQKIILYRENRLKSFISYQLSELLNQWEVYDETQLIRDRPKIRFDLTAFYEREAFDINYLSEIKLQLDKNAGKVIYLRYEELFTNEKLAEVLRFLNVRSITTELKTASIKQNSTNIKDLVENFEELERLFKGTEYEKELYAVGH